MTAVDGRIGALSRAHTLLAESRWQGADLAQIVEEELAPYCVNDTTKITRSGPHISLEPRTAQTIALSLHELATNAAKYGALSVATGRVTVSWEQHADGLTLQWIESGGPAARAPASSGFGIRMIAASIERQLQGQAAFHWDESGLCCNLAIPSCDQRDVAPRQAGPEGIVVEEKSMTPLRLKAGSHVLVVEDETLVAMFVQEVLTDCGLSVVGPFGNLSKAMVAAVHEPIDAGIIDVNLGGEFIYPIADVLAAREIPFVFVTGYGPESIERRYRHVPIIKKPVQRQTLQKLFAVAEPAKSRRTRAVSMKC